MARRVALKDTLAVVGSIVAVASLALNGYQYVARTKADSNARLEAERLKEAQFSSSYMVFPGRQDFLVLDFLTSKLDVVAGSAVESLLGNVDKRSNRRLLMLVEGARQCPKLRQALDRLGTRRAGDNVYRDWRFLVVFSDWPQEVGLDSIEYADGVRDTGLALVLRKGDAAVVPLGFTTLALQRDVEDYVKPVKMYYSHVWGYARRNYTYMVPDAGLRAGGYLVVSASGGSARFYHPGD